MEMLNQEFREPQALAFVASCFHDDDVQSYHASCDGKICHAGDSMTSGQVTRHVSDSCGCKSLHVDEDLLADCLKKGCLPLIRLEEDSNSGQMSIDVVASTDSTSYVALSHVWADGLGNPTATALPRCQLSRLKKLIDNLDFENLDVSGHPEVAREMLPWCDTLCCPVKSEEAHDMLHHGGVLEFDAPPLNTQPPTQWPRDLASYHDYIFGRHTPSWLEYTCSPPCRRFLSYTLASVK